MNIRENHIEKLENRLEKVLDKICYDNDSIMDIEKAYKLASLINSLKSMQQTDITQEALKNIDFSKIDFNDMMKEFAKEVR